MERTGHLLGVLEKFAEKRASDQLRYKAAQVELDMYPRDLRQHRSRVGITREFSAQNAGQQHIPDAPGDRETARGRAALH